MPGRRQVRHGGDAQAPAVARRRAVGAHHLLRAPVHGRRDRHGAERAARDGGHRPRAGRPRLRARHVPAGAGERAREGEEGSARRSGRRRGHGSRRAPPGRTRTAPRPVLGNGTAAARHDRREGPAGDPGVGGGNRRNGEGTPRMTASGARLSVNVNKVATLRNSRGGRVPSVVEAVNVAVASGAPGITVHPRADARHINFDDVREIAATLQPLRGRVEYNIEGDPRADLLALVREVRPDQCTLVPVRAGEVTSQAGWPPDTPVAELRAVVGGLRNAGVRVSVFIDPVQAAVEWAASLSADRIELYTEPFARAFDGGDRAARESFERYADAAR